MNAGHPHESADVESAEGAPETQADIVWAQLMRIATANLSDWRRQTSEQTGLPFSRVRVLRRLAGGSLTMKGVADAAGIDAPAASVAVNDLENRGLVARTIDPDNRRVKEVALTDAGRDAVRRVESVRHDAPAEFRTLGADDLEALSGILSRIGAETTTLVR